MATFYNTPHYHSNITDATAGLISLRLAAQHHSDITGASGPKSLRLAEIARANANYAHLGTQWEEREKHMPAQSQTDYEEKKENMMQILTNIVRAQAKTVEVVTRTADATKYFVCDAIDKVSKRMDQMLNTTAAAGARMQHERQKLVDELKETQEAYYDVKCEMAQLKESMRMAEMHSTIKATMTQIINAAINSNTTKQSIANDYDINDDNKSMEPELTVKGSEIGSADGSSFTNSHCPPSISSLAGAPDALLLDDDMEAEDIANDKDIDSKSMEPELTVKGPEMGSADLSSILNAKLTERDADTDFMDAKMPEPAPQDGSEADETLDVEFTDTDNTYSDNSTIEMVEALLDGKNECLAALASKSRANATSNRPRKKRKRKRRASRSKRKGGSHRYADSHEMPNLDHSKPAKKDKPSGGKDTKHNDAKGGNTEKKGIDKMQRVQEGLRLKGKMRDFMVSIMPKYADDDANTLADQIMYLYMKQDAKNLDLMLYDYMGAKAKQFGVEVAAFVNPRIKELI